MTDPTDLQIARDTKAFWDKEVKDAEKVKRDMAKARVEAQRMLRFQQSALESLGKRPGAERVFQEGDRFFRETMSGECSSLLLNYSLPFLSQRRPSSTEVQDAGRNGE